MRRINRYTAAAVGAVILAVSTAACGGSDEPTTEPDPTQSTASASTSPTSTTDPDAWRAQYSPAQLKAYDAALQRWESYESRSEPIWAAGKATPAAEALFKEYFPSPLWMSFRDTLATYEQVEVKITKQSTVYWSRAHQVRGTTYVVIDQCIQLGESTQWGKPTQRAGWMDEPQLRRIELQKPEGHNWLIYEVNKTPGPGEAKDKRCDPNA